MFQPDLTYEVDFTASAADRALLAAIEARLDDPDAEAFSDLCKQALRNLLVSPEPALSASLLVNLQQQIAELRLKIAVLEQDLSAAKRLDRLEAELAELRERRSPPPPVTPAPIAPVSVPLDPILSRLTPLIEDF